MSVLHSSIPLLAMAVVIFQNGINSESSQKPGKPRAELGLRAIPAVHVIWTSDLRSRYNMRYRFAFRNVTRRPFRYMSGGRTKKWAKWTPDVQLLLYKGEKFISPNESGGLHAYAKSLVRTLKPGDSLETEWTLGDYRKLKPGRYELRAKYDVKKSNEKVKKFGLTPLSFERAVMILHIDKTAVFVAPRRARSKVGLRSIPVVTIDSWSALKQRYNFAFFNETVLAHRYMLGLNGAKSCASLGLFLYKDCKLVPTAKTGSPPPFVKSRVRTLKPNESLKAELKLERYRKLKPGRYEVRAKYEVAKGSYDVNKFGLTPLSFNRIVMILHIEESLPKRLAKLTQLRMKRVTEKSHYFLGVDVGLAPVWDGKATVFFVTRQSENGKAKLELAPKRLFRLARVNPKAHIETMVYNPFPQSEDAIIEVHVLVTEPNKQRYVLVDLSSAVIVKKNKTLKPGTLYKLHKTKLGNVKLLPSTKP